MDHLRREMIVCLLVWWLHVVVAVRKCFLTMCITVALHRRRIRNRSYIDPDMADSEMPANNASEASSASRKRRRISRDREESLVETLTRVASNMNHGLLVATDKLCSCVDRLARDTDMDEKAVELYAYLLKVDGLTKDEIYAAHIKISTNNRLLLCFPTIPDAWKAAWIRQIIR